MASLSINTTPRNHVRSTSGEMHPSNNINHNHLHHHYQIPRGSTSMNNLRDHTHLPAHPPHPLSHPHPHHMHHPRPGGPGGGPGGPLSVSTGGVVGVLPPGPGRPMMERYGPPPPPSSQAPVPQHGPSYDDLYRRARPKNFQAGPIPPPVMNDMPWRPQNNLPNIERPEINVEELAGKQMLPLEPRSILEQAVDEATMTPMSRFLNMMEVLRFRGLYMANSKAFSVVDIKGRETSSWTWEKLHGRAEKISQSILEKTQLRRGSRVALVFRKSEIMDFLAAFYGCMMAGMTAVPINVIEEFAEMTYILNYTKAELALTTEYNHKALSKDLAMHKGVDWPLGVTWWKTDTLGSWNPKKKDGWPDIELPDLAYIEYSKSPNGELKGVAVSHRTMLSQCHAIKQSLGSNPIRACGPIPNSPTPLTPRTNSVSTDPKTPSTPTSATPSRRSSTTLVDGKKTDVVLSWLEPRQQVGLVLGGLLGVYRGSHTVFVHSGVTDTPGLWAHCAQRYRVNLALGDYEGVRELLRYRPTDGSKREAQSLNCLETFLIDAVMVKPMIDLQFANEFLADLGVPNPQQVVVPMSSLPEHGGMILSMRDSLVFPRGADVIDFGFEYELPRGPVPEPGAKRRPQGYSPSSNTICHYLLDRGALKANMIQVLATGEEALSRASERGVVLVGAFGYAMPKATLAIVDPETTALCQPNRVGELWIDSPSIAFGFWELPKHSQSIFHALPLIVPVDTMIPEVYDPVPAGFLRTGLLGGLIEGRVVVFGLYEDRIQQEIVDLVHPEIVEFDYHYTADLSNTILDRIVGFTACISFESFINNEHLPVICAETPRSQRVDLVKLADFAKQAMLDYHGLRLYCIAIAPTGSLPRAFKNGKRVLHPVLCRKMFELGRLRLMHIHTSVDDTVFNISFGDDTTGGIWGVEALAVREAALPPHARMVQFSCCDYPKEVLDEKTKINLSQFTSLAEILVWRTVVNQDEAAFVGVDSRGKDMKGLTFRKFGLKVVSIANFIEKRAGVRTGDKVVLLFPNCVEFAATVYSCWLLGLVPIPVQLPEASRLHEDVTLLMGLLQELKVTQIIGNTATEELMKQKTTMMHVRSCLGPRQDEAIPQVFNISKAPKINKNLGKESGYLAPPTVSLSKTAPAMVFVHYSTDMRRTLVKVSHAALLAQCRAQKVQCRFKTGRPILSSWKTFSGVGLLYSCGLGVYVGGPTVMIQYSDFTTSPHIYFEALERHGVRDAVLNYGMLELATSASEPVSPANFNFMGVKNFLLNTEGRPRTEVNQAIERRFAQSRLEKTVINTMFGHMINPMVTTRSYMNVEPVRLHVSLKSLRRGTVQITTEQEDPTGIWVEDCGIPICGTTVAIVNPETREICLSREIGEIWVSSEANVQSYQGAARENGGRTLSNASPLSVEASNPPPPSANGSEKSTIEPTSPSDFNSRYNVTIAGGDARISYVRTGEIGFLWNYSKDTFNGGKPTSLLFVLGSIGETFEVNGLMHFPKDIEATVERAHPNVTPNGSIVFQADQAVVVVVQVRQPDFTVVNLTLSVMHQVLEKHQFMPDVIAVVGEGVLTKNRFGEKQRGKMLSLFMSAKMPLLYIHYPRGKLPQSVPEQMQPSGPMTPMISRLGSNGTYLPHHGGHPSPVNSGASGTSSNVSQTGEKPSSIRSSRSTTSKTSMASMRSVKSFIGTMFNNLKGGPGGVGPGAGFSHSLGGKHGNGGGGAYPAGYSHHAHGSTSSISGTYPGSSRPGSGSSIGLATSSSFTGAQGSNLSYNSISLNGSNVSAEYSATSGGGSNNSKTTNENTNSNGNANNAIPTTESSSPSSLTTLMPELHSDNSSGTTLMPSALVSSPSSYSGTSPILDRAGAALASGTESSISTSTPTIQGRKVIRAPGTPGASSPTSAVVSGMTASPTSGTTRTTNSNGSVTAGPPVVVVNTNHVPFSETIDGFP
ncbi:hypothetical protein BGZ83_007482 [Gryganskiella cystojenkinii]|nr:hypothetical protein BGZ83_007482 [Gryganskiella cystojenkinii]